MVAGREPVAIRMRSKRQGIFPAPKLFHPQGIGVDEARPALDVGDLALLADHPEAAGQLRYDAFFERAQLVDVDLRLAELHSPDCRMARLVDHLGDVQQRLGRNAAPVKADAAGILLQVDQRDLHAEVVGQESRGIAARPAADDG